MSSDQLIHEALSLPLPERILIAQALWHSIDTELHPTATDEKSEAVKLATLRAADFKAGSVEGRSHEQVMEAARRMLP